MGVFDRLRQRCRRKETLRGLDKLSRTTVGDIMTSYVVSVSAQDSVIKAATKMVAEDVSCVVVMDDGTLSGILSERDFLRKVPLTARVFGMQVKDIMTPEVVTVSPATLLPDAVKMMRDRRFRRLVVSDGQRTLGIVTQTDFSRALAKLKARPVGFPVDAILRAPVIATTKESFTLARERMRKEDIGATIIDEKGHIMGMFSEYDVLMQFYDQHGKMSVTELTSFTKKYVRAITPGTSIFEANALLLSNKVHRVPVVKEGKILGLLTQTELVRHVYCNMETIRGICTKPEMRFERVAVPKGEFVSERLKIFRPAVPETGPSLLAGKTEGKKKG